MVFHAMFDIPYTSYKFQKIVKTKIQLIEKNNLRNRVINN